MSTILLVFRRELMDLWRTRQLPALLIGCILLLGSATWLGVAEHEAAERSRQTYEQANWAKWIGQGKVGPHMAAHYGQYVFKPEQPAAALDPGLRDVAGTTVVLETHQRSDWLFPRINDANPAARIARGSVADILQIIGPLIIFLMGFRVYAAERERGTLAWVAATSANPYDIMAGKALAILAASAILLAPFVGYAAWLLVSGPVSGATIARLALMAGVYFVYFMIFVAMTVAVSARARTSAQAMAILLLIWVVACIAAPRLGVLAADRLFPPPSESAFAEALQHDMERTADGGYWIDRRREQLLKETLAKYRVDSIDKLPIGYAGVMLADSEQHTTDVYAEHYRQLEALHDRQDASRQLVAGLLGPQTATASLSSELAASSSGAYRRFEHAAETYRRAMIDRLNKVVIENGKKSGWDLTVDRAFLEATPRFQTPPSAITLGGRANLIGLAVMAVWLALAGLFALLSVRSMRAR